MNSIAKLTNIGMNYGSGDVLGGLNLELAPGRIIALLGINGAGKSTLMQILAGHIRPTAGTIELAGTVAMVFQELSLLPDLSIAENLFLSRLSQFRSFGRLDRDAIQKASEVALSRVGLAINPRQPASSLTTGEAQLVEIARALDQNPSILILDEPTSALSRKECDRLFLILRKLAAEQGRTILFVSHRLDEVQEIADEVVVLKDGTVAGRLGRQDIDARRIVELMTGIETAQTSRQHAHSARTGNEILLRLVNVSVTDGTHELAALSGVFTLYAGQCVGLAGLMGAGRSVFLRALASRLKLASGGVSVPRQDLTVQGTVRGAPIAYVHEDRKGAGLFLDLPAIENIAIAERGRDRFARAEKLFRTLSVKGAPQARAATFSGGNQQKLLFGRALLSGARVLLLDEPTRGVDASARQEIYKMMRDFTNDGGAILWVSSDFDELAEQSDAVLRICRARISSALLHPASGAELTRTVLEQEARCEI